MKKSVLCLLSGGIDSTVMAKHYLDKGWYVHGLFIEHGQSQEAREHTMVKALALRLNISIKSWDTDFVYDGYFGPCRNALFLCAAVDAAYNLGIKNVAIGLALGEYLDTRGEFIDRFNFMQEYCLKNPIYVLAPFSNWSAEKVIKYGLKIGAPLDLTTSCMDTPACGECLKCKLRKKYGIGVK